MTISAPTHSAHRLRRRRQLVLLSTGRLLTNTQQPIAAAASSASQLGWNMTSRPSRTSSTGIEDAGEDDEVKAGDDNLGAR